MGLSRRAFLKYSAAAGMSTIFQRYDWLIKAIGASSFPTSAAPAAASVGIQYLEQYHSLFDVIRRLIWTEDQETYAYGLSEILPDTDLDESSLASLSQKALVKMYKMNMDTLQWQANEVFELLKHGDHIPDMLSLVEENTVQLAEQVHIPAPMIKDGIALIRQDYGTREKVMNLLNEVVDRHADVARQIEGYLNPSSIKELSQQTFMRLTDLDFNIPYRFDLKHIRGVTQAIRAHDSGTFLDVLDIPDEWRSLINTYVRTDEAKGALARRILDGDASYYDVHVAEKYGLQEKNFEDALNEIVQERANSESISDHHDDLKDERVDTVRLSEDLQHIQHLLETRQLHIAKEAKPLAGGDLFSVTWQGDQSLLTSEMDHVSSTLDFILTKAAFTLDRHHDDDLSIHYHDKQDHYGPLMQLEEYAEYCRTLSFFKRTASTSDATVDLATRMQLIKKQWPNFSLR